MDKLTGKFDVLDSRLDSLEEKRKQLKDSISTKQAQTPLGRLNQVPHVPSPSQPQGSAAHAHAWRGVDLP